MKDDGRYCTDLSLRVIIECIYCLVEVPPVIVKYQQNQGTN
jgi:hypothetical protein